MRRKCVLLPLPASKVTIYYSQAKLTCWFDIMNGQCCRIRRLVSPSSPWYYQEQAFIARLEAGINQLSDLNKKKICLYPDAEKSIKGLADNVERIGFPSFGIAVKAFENSQCDALPGEVSRLAIARLNFLTLLKHRSSSLIYPHPAAPLIRQGDHEWFKIVRWITYWLLNAEKQVLPKPP